MDLSSGLRPGLRRRAPGILDTPYKKLAAICFAALLLRLPLLPFIRHPGLGDPNHYYNLGVRLVDGHGFTIDYIWHYNVVHDDLVHPIDHWMPLTGVLAAASMSLFGVGVPAALLPFVLIGALAIPALAYAAARRFGCSEFASLGAAALAAVLPEFVLNSVRTDTTIPNSVFVCSSLLLFAAGLERAHVGALVGSGIMAGLAYLTRNDALLLIPAFVVTLVVYRWAGSSRIAPNLRWYHLPAVFLAAGLVVAPWIVRNIQVLGAPTTPELGKMVFFTDVRDSYAYQREFNLQTHLAAQTPAQIVGKRLFELAAAFKVMYTTLDVFLPVAAAGGFIWLATGRDRSRLLVLAPTLILLAGMLLAYPILVPYKSQAGSFKKAYLSMIPLLIPLGTYAVERAISSARIRTATLLMVVLLMGANAVELVRADAAFTNRFLAQMQQVVEVAQTLPDTNGDSEIILMAQDPFMLRFLGVRSAMIPMAERDAVLEVARRYGLDYILMPPDRPPLDAIYLKTETDPHFVYALEIPGTNMALYRFELDPGEGESRTKGQG